jgi:5,10-methylenetetrahydrofolate reductase
MDDAQILQQIEKLVREERELRDKADGGLADEERARLQSIEVALDQCWDLLRQRRALREFGEDAEGAQTRDASTVERYEQ